VAGAIETDLLQERAPAKPEPKVGVLILSEVRLVAEGLADALERDAAMSIYGFCTDIEEGFREIAARQPQIVLLDATLTDGPRFVGRILTVAPQARVVPFAVTETAENVIAWAEAGVAGYIPRTIALADVASVLSTIMRDEQACSARIAASLLRRLSHATIASNIQADVSPGLDLTAREMQVLELLAAGLSNKDIARRLNIGVATTKSHVHNLLGKLRVQRRGQAALWIREHYAGPARSVGLPVTSRPGA
jgi:DNA-binding NarL/FixJ family response regulator